MGAGADAGYGKVQPREVGIQDRGADMRDVERGDGGSRDMVGGGRKVESRVNRVEICGLCAPTLVAASIISYCSNFKV